MGPHNTSDDPTRYVDPVELERAARVRPRRPRAPLPHGSRPHRRGLRGGAASGGRGRDRRGGGRCRGGAGSRRGRGLQPRLRQAAPARDRRSARRPRTRADGRSSTWSRRSARRLADAMERDERIMLLGQDIGVNGGVFRATEGLQERFGEDRVVDMPLAEAVIVGSSVGLACSGLVPIPELQFLGFGSQAFHQIEGQVARMRFRSQGRVPMPMVIRAPFGGNVRTPELHSDAHEAKYASAAGLKVVMPATAHDAKGMLAEAIRDPDPVLFCEPLRGYRLIKDEVPEEEYTVPLGTARTAREGDDVVVVAWSAAVVVAERAAELAAEEGISARRARPAQPRAARRRGAARGGRPPAGARSSCTRPRSRAASAPRWWRRSRRRPSGRSRRRSAASRHPTRRIRSRRSRSSTCPRSSACSPASGRWWEPRLSPDAASAIRFRLPDVGEGIDAAEILEWHVAAGDRVREHQELVEIQTDKAVVVIPCPATGVVTELCARAGRRAGRRRGAGGHRARRRRRQRRPCSAPPPAEPLQSAGAGGPGDRAARGWAPLAAPATRRRARELGVDLAAVTASGPQGRILREDVERARRGAPGERRRARRRGGAPPAARPPPRRVRRRGRPAPRRAARDRRRRSPGPGRRSRTSSTTARSTRAACSRRARRCASGPPARPGGACARRSRRRPSSPPRRCARSPTIRTSTPRSTSSARRSRCTARCTSGSPPRPPTG